MLTVVVIIGILASLITGAVMRARVKAMQTVIALEINQLEWSLTQYKQKHGKYPPDFAGLNSTDPAVRQRAQRAVLRHLTTAFPLFRILGADTSTKWASLTPMVAAYGVDINQMDPSTALVFWLGGLPDGPGSKRLIGFSANPRNPFDPGEDLNGNGTLDAGEDQNGNGVLDHGSRLAPLFKFDPGCLKIVDDVLRYYPDVGGTGENAPYVYFRASNRGYDDHPGFTPALYAPPQPAHPEWGETHPCRDTRVPVPTNVPPYDWANPDSFQIRAAGLDGTFGPGVMFPTGDDYNDDATFDDQTNFSDGTLEDKM